MFLNSIKSIEASKDNNSLIYTLIPTIQKPLGNVDLPEPIQKVEIPLERLSFLINIIKKTLNISETTFNASDFLSYCAKNKIDLTKDFNFLEYSSFEDNFSVDSIPEIKEVAKKYIDTYGNDLKCVTFKGGSFYNYDKITKKYRVGLKGEYLSVNSFNIRKFAEKVIKRKIQNTYLLYIDVFVLDEIKESLYLKFQNEPQMLGTHSSFKNKRTVYYDFPSLPVDLDFIINNEFSSEMEDKINTQVFDYWNKYKIVKSLPNEIQDKISTMNNKEKAKFLETNSKDFFEDIEFYSEEELKEFFVLNFQKLIDFLQEDTSVVNKKINLKNRK